MTNKFKSKFKDYVCEGDKISAYIDGVDYTARVYRDDNLEPPDKRQDGFWPSLDPKDCGYIGDKGQAEFDKQMRHAKAVMRGWKNDEWFYCGIVLEVEINDEVIEKHAESLWGIERNYPPYDTNLTPNEYLTTVANELLDEHLRNKKKVGSI